MEASPPAASNDTSEPVIHGIRMVYETSTETKRLEKHAGASAATKRFIPRASDFSPFGGLDWQGRLAGPSSSHCPSPAAASRLIDAAAQVTVVCMSHTSKGLRRRRRVCRMMFARGFREAGESISYGNKTNCESIWREIECLGTSALENTIVDEGEMFTYSATRV